MGIWTEKLLAWYEQEKRDLPWRKTKDPYAIWISEIMLQQTRVETVRDYYGRWMERFPDLKALAGADLQDVFKLWEGLGYYSRASNLHRAANLIAEEMGGTFPASPVQILNLPGVGPYTAGAIASIAFNQPIPAVDGNVLRVMSRLFALPEIDKRDIQGSIKNKIQNSFPPDRAGDFTQSLMELGALVCLPRRPACNNCPLTTDCAAYTQKAQNLWPIRKKRVPVKPVPRQVAVIMDGSYILMHQRPPTGLLADLWEFPGVEGGNKQDFAARFAEEYELKLKVGKHLLDARHVFTHLEWQMKVYLCGLESTEALSKRTDFTWVNRLDLEKLTIPSAFKKIKLALLSGMHLQ